MPGKRIYGGYRPFLYELEDEVKRLKEENKRLKRLNQRMYSVLWEMYRVSAGMVISSQTRYEKEAEQQWNSYCHRILDAIREDWGRE